MKATIAGPVQHMPQRGSAILQRKCACGGQSSRGSDCEECKKKKLQRKSNNASGPAMAPPIVHEVLNSPGQPLDHATRDFMESRLGHDFGRVRVHVGEKAAESARSVNADAYTVGQKVVFGNGRYSPESTAGQELIAHELVHTIQQQSRVYTRQPLEISQPQDSSEREADSVSRTCLAGRKTAQPKRSAAKLARQTGQSGNKDEEFRRSLQDLAGKGPVGPSAETPEQKIEREKKEKLLEGAKSKEWGRSTSGAKATWGWAAPETTNVTQECNVVGYDRPEFLSYVSALPRPPAPPTRRTPGAPNVVLGATQLRGTVKTPEIATEAVPGGFKLKPTHAEMPSVYSAYTKANDAGFDEGTRQCLSRDCEAERKRLGTSKFPIHWTITPGGAEKLKAGEKEHCEDYRAAFQVTLALYASVLNNLAAHERLYSSEKQAIDEANRYLPVRPDDMLDRFLAAAEKSRLRDDLGWHAANDNFPQGNPHSQFCSIENGCRPVEIIDENSLPGIDAHSFEELMTVKPPAKQGGKP